MFITQLLENTQEPSIVVVYAGRFQPFHKGHHAVFNWLTGKYGRNNVYIATSNKTDALKSPFTFQEKAYFMNLTGVPADRIVESAQPYRAEEIIKNYNPQTTLLMFAVSEKDMAEDPRFKVGAKKDGSPSYFQHLPANLRDAKTFNEHAYLVVTPKFDFTILGQPADSASQIRAMYTQADDATRKNIIADLFGKYTPEAQQIMDNKLGAAQQEAIESPKYGKMYEEAAGVGSVKGGNDPRYVMATTGDQNDVNSKTLGNMMKAYKLVGQKAPKTGQSQVKSNIAESQDPDFVSPVERAILRRIMHQRTDLLSHGPAAVMDAAREVAEFVGDVEEIGSSDVSGWVRHVEQLLGNMQDEPREETLEDKLRSQLKQMDEGMTKQMMWDDAERMELKDFMDKWGHEEWVAEFWTSINEDELDEGWKDWVAGGALAAGLAFGGGAAHAQDVNPAQQAAPAVTAQAQQGSTGMYTAGVTHPAAYTINYKGQDYKFAGRGVEAPQGGEQVTVGAGAIGIRSLKPVNVILAADGQYYMGGPSMNENRDREWDEGDTEPANNFAVYINGKKWKVFPAGNWYADSFQERQRLQQLQRWAAQKSAQSGKKWTVHLTGEAPTAE